MKFSLSFPLFSVIVPFSLKLELTYEEITFLYYITLFLITYIPDSSEVKNLTRFKNKKPSQ